MTLPTGPMTTSNNYLAEFLGSNRSFLPSSGGTVLRNLGRTFLPSGGTRLPGSQVYGSNVDPRLLRAYLPKNQRWSEPRKEDLEPKAGLNKGTQAAVASTAGDSSSTPAPPSGGGSGGDDSIVSLTNTTALAPPVAVPDADAFDLPAEKSDEDMPDGNPLSGDEERRPESKTASKKKDRPPTRNSLSPARPPASPLQTILRMASGVAEYVAPSPTSPIQEL